MLDINLEFIFIATSHKHCAFTITYVRFGNLSLFASYTMLMRPKQLSMAASNQAHYFLMLDLRGKARYQRGHSAQCSGIKLATSTFVLSILEFIFLLLHNEGFWRKWIQTDLFGEIAWDGLGDGIENNWPRRSLSRGIRRRKVQRIFEEVMY